jgi:hypothetical protein
MISSFISVDREQYHSVCKTRFFEIELEKWQKKMMKILTLILTTILLIADISAQKVITCKVMKEYPIVCSFSFVKIKQNETVTIKLDPAETDPSTILVVYFLAGSIYSIPPEVFTKFPNTREFWAHYEEIEEIAPDTFREAKKLEKIGLVDNQLTVLHRDTFKGNFPVSLSFAQTLNCDFK